MGLRVTGHARLEGNEMADKMVDRTLLSVRSRYWY